MTYSIHDILGFEFIQESTKEFKQKIDQMEEDAKSKVAHLNKVKADIDKIIKKLSNLVSFDHIYNQVESFSKKLIDHQKVKANLITENC